jgi:predicted nuclease with RNAse H fold/dephospho-CoA kinase
MECGTPTIAAREGQSVLPFAEPVPDTSNQQKRRKSAPPERRNAPSLEPRLIRALDAPHRVMFLDIETTGLSHYYDELTLVGWSIGDEYRVHIIGDEPATLMQSLQSAEVIVTFNGTLFDLPFLRRTFSNSTIPPSHVDLRYLARRVGLTGGLKAIEKTLGIYLRDGIAELDGSHAVLLWHRYLRGDLQSLRLLIEYNRADVLAMRYLLDEIIERLSVSPDLWLSPTRFSGTGGRLSGWSSPTSVLPSPSRLGRSSHSFVSLFTSSPAAGATVVGIDLTGSERRPSGWCVLRGASAETAMIASDDEVVARISALRPSVVSIDSPLSLPFGRTHVGDDDPTRESAGIMRRCERELKRRGINVYPCLLPSMQALTERGIRLATRLRALGVPVIESYPGAAQDIMGIPRKGAGEHFLKQGLAEFGIEGDFLKSAVSHDELDAITAALVGSFFLAGKYEALAGPGEDALIIPDLDATSGPLVVGISGRICAGKTTAALSLERQRFAYTRFSQVLDSEIASRGETPNRESRQRIGLEVHRTKGQRWLCERVLEQVKGQPFVVVDGLRFPEDRAFFVERFGSRFLHLHLTAPLELRRQRYPKSPEDGPTFAEADSEPVEGEIDKLGELAAIRIDNSASIDELITAVNHAVEDFARRFGEECQFPSS